MLSRVHFAGIKSLLDVTVDLERFTVLVGPNGCGKSTLLDQIELICRASWPGAHETHVLAAAGRELAALGPLPLGPAAIRTAGQGATMLWAAQTSGSERFVIEVGPTNRPDWWTSTKVTAWKDGTDTQLKPDAPQSRPRIDEVLAAHFSWPTQRLRLMPDAVAAPSPVELTALSADGFGLPTILKDLAGNDTSIFEAVQRDLRHVVPHFERLRFEKSKVAISDGVTVDAVVLFLEMRGGGRLSVGQVSDGTRLALALLTATHNRDLPSIVLMDDIDHGLHLSAQYEIIQAIRRVMEQRPELQVICTTHSPVLLDSFDKAEVRVMALDQAGHTRVKPLTAHPNVDSWRGGFSAGELWANLGEDWVIDG